MLLILLLTPTPNGALNIHLVRKCCKHCRAGRANAARLRSDGGFRYVWRMDKVCATTREHLLVYWYKAMESATQQWAALQSHARAEYLMSVLAAISFCSVMACPFPVLRSCGQANTGVGQHRSLSIRPS